MSTEQLQILDVDGKRVGPDPGIDRDDLRKLYRHMMSMRVLDKRMLSLQRQGRIGFYGTATGEEAAVTGSAYAMRNTDWVFPALRQMGVSLWRGTTIQEFCWRGRLCQTQSKSLDNALQVRCIEQIA